MRALISASFCTGAVAQTEGDILEDAQMRKEGEVLEDEADVAQMRGLAVDPLPVDRDDPLIGLLEARDQAQKRSLARPRSA